MTFLTPFLLCGFLSLLIPIGIHIFSKPKLKKVRWAAIRFLAASVQKNRRRTQLEDLLLLVLRCLILALLVLYFARPAFLVDDLGPLLSQEPVTAVLILDNSASMGQSDGFRTRFDQAKAMSKDILENLASGSTCAFYLETDRPQALISKPTENLSLLSHAIDSSTLSDGGSDLYPGLRNAVDLLKNSANKNREIFVLTDSQISAWRQMEAIEQLQNQNKDIKFSVVVVGDKGGDNLAVTGLSIDGSNLAVEQPISCTITVSNYSHAVVQQIPVKLSLDDQPPQAEGMIARIEPGASQSIQLTARFKTQGYHNISASIPGDLLPFDNQRALALFVIDKIHCLVVEGVGKNANGPGDGFFLKYALAPVSAEESDKYFTQVQLVQAGGLETADYKSQLIFLSNVASLSRSTLGKLKQFVTEGGGLIIFPGSSTNPQGYNDPDSAAWLPATFGTEETPPSGVSSWHWQAEHYDNALTALWNQPDSGNLGGVEITKRFPLKPRTGTTVVLKYDDGTPAVVEETCGKGKVLMFSSGVTTDSTNLPIYPSFVPLMSRIVSEMTNRPDGEINIAPGDLFSAPVSLEYAGQAFYVKGPGDSTRRAAGSVEPGERAAYLRYNDTSKAGAYHLSIGDDTQDKVVFAVLQDPSESNLAQEPKPTVAPLLNPPVTVMSDGQTVATINRPQIPGTELWFPLALAALLLAIGEMGLAQYSSQSK